jgi:hypothetical protein
MGNTILNECCSRPRVVQIAAQKMLATRGDGYAISRIAENSEILCHEICAGTGDARIIYFELGQLLRTMRGWRGSQAPQENRSLTRAILP